MLPEETQTLYPTMFLCLQAGTAGQHTAVTQDLPGVHGTSLLLSKDTRTVAAARLQGVPHRAGRHLMEGQHDDTAGSPDLDQQV